MTDTRYLPQHKAVLDTLLLPVPGVKASKLFGHPSYSIGGKVFACLVEHGVIVKLPSSDVDALLDGRTYTPFLMGDRVSKGWVKIIHADPEAYHDNEPLLQRAIEYVLEEAHSGRQKKRASSR